jgi:hypothetical protein
MVYSKELLENPFVLQMYEDILNYAYLDYLDHTEKALRDDIYFIMNSDIPHDLYLKYRLFFPYRTNH